MTDDGIRLAKRVAAQLACSRADAERYIAGGWVSVDGNVTDDPASRVAPGQDVRLLPGATAEEPTPVTILLHKPAGFNSGVGVRGEPALGCVTPQAHDAQGHGQQRFLKRHLTKLALTSPLETDASGLVVFTQDFRVARKLVDEASRVEQEYIVEVAGTIAEHGLKRLNHGLTFNGKPIAPMKVSWQNEHRLRFALKDVRPGLINHMCGEVGLEIVEMRRIRIGRVSMAGLGVGQWRYLLDFERF
ncbi:rRNA pseudouridine synthase [Massilia yuzhufengensis]|uniref:Dual-specificity RNA pseudouridine synthase RluF n=1 Tax=Massilia yuzhufengensis TaxID=1164594 RepID=A0A1I1H3E9_9BURK|nr:rRNA pseudouridine synthase [Massilia yuzhufengensis]SFC18276.1 23S rRNA pseudouridine2604 synthase [Massilia yuzhufengensis]